MNSEKPICIICGQEVKSLHHWHHSVCSSKCAKDRKRQKRIENYRKQKALNVKKSGERLLKAQRQFSMDGNQGLNWLQFFGNANKRGQS